MHIFIQNLEVKNLRCMKDFKRHEIKNHSNMFRIVCDPSSGSIELYLTEITHSASKSHFEPVVCVHKHTPLFQNYAAKHRPSTRQTSVNHYE